jgi:hypothetical protein
MSPRATALASVRRFEPKKNLRMRLSFKRTPFQMD